MRASVRPQRESQRIGELCNPADRRLGWPRRAFAVGAASALILAACGSPSPSASMAGGQSTPPVSGAPSGPRVGGTIYILSQFEQLDELDPQRAYGGDGLAFFGATLQRSLLQYKASSDVVEAGTLVPDLATDTGTTEDGTSWTFGLRTDAKWQGGDPITCEDIAYGVSRTFATDVIVGGPTYQIQYLDIPADGYPGPYRATPEVVPS